MQQMTVAVAVLAMCVFSIPAVASDGGRVGVGPPPSMAPPAVAIEVGSTVPPEINAFGVGALSAVHVPSEEFNPVHDGVWAHDYLGNTYRDSGTNEAAKAHVQLPSGALLKGVTVWVADNSATGNVTCNVDEVSYEPDPNEYIDLFDHDSGVVATPGEIEQYFPLPGGDHTVSNNAKALRIFISHSETGDNLQNGGVTFWYQLQVSPAPASATFADVPTGHPFFQHIEALADSGITAGCGGGNFCPNSPVTRGQLAVFLSKALGLHWDN